MTTKLEFSDKYLVGVRQIDREHRKLFQIIALIQDALELGDDQALAAAQRAVAELIEYTNTHFASEESLMARYGYPEAEAHQRLHADLLRQVHDMEMRVEIEGSAATLEISRLIGQWLTQHIQIADKRFGAFVAESDGP